MPEKNQTSQSVAAPYQPTKSNCTKLHRELHGQNVLAAHMCNSQGGRPISATVQQVLEMVAKYKSTNHLVLAKKLHVSIKTIQRRIRQIPKESIKQALGNPNDTKLKTAEMEWSIFQEVPCIAEYRENMLHVLSNTEKYVRNRVRMLYRTCVHLGMHPSYLEPLMAKDLLLEIRKGIVQIGEYDFRMGMRSWFTYRGISGRLLSSLGLDSNNAVKEDTSRLRLTPEQRQLFIETMRTLVLVDWSDGKGAVVHFGLQPYLAKAALYLPKFLFYTGTRIGRNKQKAKKENIAVLEKGEKAEHETGTLSLTWDKVRFLPKYVDFEVYDKCGITWHKQLVGKAYAEFLRFWGAVGNPKTGLIFPFEYEYLRRFFTAVYEAAGIPKKDYGQKPFHIWRHTACQELLRATHKNYELTAAILGWENTKVMKDHYDALQDDERAEGLREAMGEEVVKEKKEFIF